MNLAKRIRDLRYSKGWGPDELANRAKISRTALYQIERGNTSKPQAGTLRRISRALGVPLEILLDSTSILAEGMPSSEGPSEVGTFTHMASGVAERSLSSDRADELIEKFRMLLASPLADGIARIVEESFRLLPIIPPPAASAVESNRPYVPSLDIDMPRRGRGRPRITTPGAE